jgi:glycosyltransferase involved in cell wall biosynthesis
VLKILHLIPTLEGGGAERQLMMLVTEQAKRGYRVHVASRRGGVYDKQLGDSEVITHRLGDLKSVHPLLIARINKLIRRIKPDIVQTWLPQMDLCGGVATVWNSVPWIVSERTSSAAYDRKTFLRGIRVFLAKHAKAVIANSTEGVEYWSSKVPSAVKLFTINNAVDTDAINDAVPFTYGRTDGRVKILLFVGRLLPVKAPEVFLEAVKQLRDRQDFHALIMGEGPLRQPLSEKIISEGLERHVTVLAYQAEWWGLLKTAIALVSTSRFEGQPNAVLEAMAAGCPLIVSDIAAHRSILNDDSAFMVPLDNPRMLARSIEALLENPEMARKRVNQAMDRAAAFTIKSTADAYERVYARMFDGRIA